MSSIKKHIVLITTWYPPQEGIAVNRMSAFAKYLDKEQFSLTVVTLGTEKIHGSQSENGVNVFRVHPKRSFWNPSFNSRDSRFLHLTKTLIRKTGMKLGAFRDKHFVREASTYLEKLQMQRPVDLVLSSFSPVEPHLVGLEFCQKHKTPWIVDMRDEMSQNPQADAATRKYLAKVEASINTTATALITVSEPIVEYFRQVIPDLKFYEEIRNGYELDPPVKANHFNKVYTMLHAGSFYGTRKPDTLFKALENMKRKGSLPDQWKFICAGAAKNFAIPETLREHVEIIPRVTHQESIALMASADLNVLIQPPTGRKGVYTGKVFEYLSVLKPVLAVVDTGDVAARLIGDVNAGYCAEFTEVEAIEDALEMAISNWQLKKQPGFDREAINNLHRRYQVQKLNLLITKILHEA